jgi:hypothetical protein
VQYLNGYVSEQGRQVGIPTPFNDKVVELITGVSPGMLKPKPDPKNVDPAGGDAAKVGDHAEGFALAGSVTCRLECPAPGDLRPSPG